MVGKVEEVFEKRPWRHLLFWVSWVIVFTFIQSFGKPFEHYFGWFSYYVITLPIFVSHTYIIAYLLVPRFFNRRLLPIFIFLFLALLYGFSIMELILSHEFIFNQMVEQSSPEITRAIAFTSELLSDVMIFHDQEYHFFVKEIELVKKLVRLVSLFRESEPDIELFLSGDPEHLSIPPLILFTLVDVIFRSFDKAYTLPEIHIEASGFSKLITFQIYSIDNSGQKDDLDDCCRLIRKTEACYAGKVPIYYKKHNYGCSVFINTVYSNSSVIHKEEAPAD